MFTRIVEMNAQAGKGGELSRTITDRVVPVLKDQPGFVDEIVLVSEQNPDRLVALSFWKTQQDAEKYNRETFSRVTEMLRSHSEGPPKVQTFNVEYSTPHHIAAGKAA